MRLYFRKSLTAAVLALAIALGAGAGVQAQESMKAGQKTVTVETADLQAQSSLTANTYSQGIPAYKSGNTVMVSAQDIAGYPGLGVAAKYKKKKKRLEIDRNNIHGTITAGKKKMIVNSEIKYKLPAAIRVTKQADGKQLVLFPAKKVGNVLGLNYRYDAAAGKVIYTPKKAKVTSLKNLQTKPFMLMSTEEFVKFLGPIAREDCRKTGMLASVTIAQAIHESYSGCSLLAQKGNNLFGMKAYLSGNNWSGSTWKGKVYVKRTKEQYGRRVVTITARFRKYDNVMQNIADHSAYFLHAKNGARKRYAGLTKTKSYKKQLKILKKGGYCTFSSYTKNLEKLIKKYNLTQYDH